MCAFLTCRILSDFLSSLSHRSMMRLGPFWLAMVLSMVTIESLGYDCRPLPLR